MRLGVGKRKSVENKGIFSKGLLDLEDARGPLAKGFKGLSDIVGREIYLMVIVSLVVSDRDGEAQTGGGFRDRAEGIARHRVSQKSWDSLPKLAKVGIAGMGSGKGGIRLFAQAIGRSSSNRQIDAQRLLMSTELIVL
jgi:hypothetical protein